jgi:spermidine synthase
VKPSVTLAQTTTSDGATLSLRLHDGHYHMRIGGHGLMSTIATRSEVRLAELGCERLVKEGRKRVLIGGLGFGFTLRRVLELVTTDVKVEVAELLPQVVAWNREYLRSVNGGLVDDPRVRILIEDVFALLARATAGHYDAVLLDVDNGPAALVDRGNARLYADHGLRVLSRALRVGGRAVFWSASPERSFMARLAQAGFRAEAVAAKAYAKSKRGNHTLFVADWNG